MDSKQKQEKNRLTPNKTTKFLLIFGVIFLCFSLLLIFLSIVLELIGIVHFRNVSKMYPEYLGYSLGEYVEDCNWVTDTLIDGGGVKYEKKCDFIYHNYLGEKQNITIYNAGNIESQISTIAEKIISNEIRKILLGSSEFVNLQREYDIDFSAYPIVNVKKASSHIELSNPRTGLKLKELSINNLSKNNLVVSSSLFKVSLDGDSEVEYVKTKISQVLLSLKDDLGSDIAFHVTLGIPSIGYDGNVWEKSHEYELNYNGETYEWREL